MSLPLSPPPMPPLVPVAACASGNRCGHVPSAPRFDGITLPAHANPARPHVILKAVARIQAYYGQPRENRWDALSQGERAYRRQRAHPRLDQTPPPTGHDTPTLLQWRQQRSERREAIIAVLMLLLPYTDLHTLTVGIPRSGDWLGLSIPWIAAHTGLSASRAKRALTTLTRGGWLTRTGQGRHFDRRRRCWIGIGWGPVRRLSFKLIRALDLEVAWHSARRRHQKQVRRQETATARPSALPPLVDIVPAPARPSLTALVRPAMETRDRDAHIERNRRLAELAAQGLTPAEIRQRLQDAPQPP